MADDDMIGTPTSPAVTVRMVLVCAAMAYDCTERELLAHKRGEPRDTARRAAIWVAYELMHHGSHVIGRHFGQRDHSTILHAVHDARRRRMNDPAFCERTDSIRAAVIRLAGSAHARRFGDVDVPALIDRVMRDPMREAMRVSTVELSALARRCDMLEEVAAGTFRLISLIDVLSDIDPRSVEDDDAHARDLRVAIAELTDTIVSALAALDYQTETDHGVSTQDQGDIAKPACAAE